MPDTYALENGDHLPVRPTLWPDPEHGPWLLVLFWQLIDGRATCVGLDLTSTRTPHVANWYPLRDRPEIGTPLTTSALRDLKLSEVVAEQRADMADFVVTEQAEVYAPQTMREATRKRLKLVAETYRQAWQRGQAPTKAVAKKLKISDPAAAKLVARARSAGFLPATSQGVAAGEPAG